MRQPACISIDGDSLCIDGALIHLSIIPQILYEIAHPDPRKWYRLERVDESIIVHVRVTEDSDGTPVSRSNA